MMNTTINAKILHRLCEPYYFVITHFQKFQLYFIMKSLAGAKIAFYCYSAQTIAAGLLKSNLGGSTNFLQNGIAGFLSRLPRLLFNHCFPRPRVKVTIINTNVNCAR